MRNYHILNGDALKEQLASSINGEHIVFREALIEGPIKKEKFFEARSKFIQETFGASQEYYISKSKNELLKINCIPNESNVFLWFEDDLFCQCNLWYAASNLIGNLSNLNIYLVRPDSDSWHGFGSMDKKRLEQSFENKTLLEDKQLKAFSQLWDLYLVKEENIPSNITRDLSSLIPRIDEILKAHTDRLAPNNRPYNSLKKILATEKKMDFKAAFKSFTEVEGIYGYGDSSIRRMYDEIIARK